MGLEYFRNSLVLPPAFTLGPVIFIDDFSDLLKWTKGGTTGDFIFELDPNTAYSDNNSLHLKTRATSAADSDTMKASREAMLFPSKLATFITHFKIGSSYPTFTYFSLWYCDGANTFEAMIRYADVAGTWAYKDIAGNYQTFYTPTIKLYHYAFHRLSLEVDFNTNKYRYIRIDDKVVDLTNKSFYNPAGFTAHDLTAQVDYITGSAAAREMWIDNPTLVAL